MIRYFKVTFRIFMNYRHLLFNLVSRDIKVKYRRSFLGIAWSVLNPLLMAVVMSIVFGAIFRDMGAGQRVVPATGLPPEFLIYVLSGQLIFNFFSESTNAALDSVFSNAGLIKKVYIPKYIFPLEKVMFGFVNTLFSLVALFIVIFFCILFRGTVLTPWAFLLPLPLILLFFFNLGVGLVLSALVVFFRDIKHLYGIFVQALVYLTPIFWSENILPGWVNTLVRFNPMYWFVYLFRQLVVYGEAPTTLQLFVPTACAVVTLVAGLLIFRKTQDDFILYI